MNNAEIQYLERDKILSVLEWVVGEREDNEQLQKRNR